MAEKLPSDIAPLTSLRFVAAFWVLAYHFKDHLGLDLGRMGLVARGWLGVDLFFILSGFILSHVYLRTVEAGAFRYGEFLKNRIARIYPLHIATLLAMLGLYALAAGMGAGVAAPSAFKFSDLPQHLLMIHAWGATQTVGWNFPSWSISAEWAAYLLFPVFAALVIIPQRPVLVLMAALGLCLLSYSLLDHLHEWQGMAHVGRGFEQMTAQIGALRILPSFLLGAALYAFTREHAMPRKWARPIAIVSAIWVVLVCSMNWWPAYAWFGLVGLIYGLAEMARHGAAKPMNARWFVFLGAASYALYMTHLPIDIVYFHTLERLGVTEAASLWLRIAALFGVFLVCIAVSAGAYLWLEEPLRNGIRRTRFTALFSKRKRAPDALRGFQES
ncbi:MAG: acyltransferase family protein [Hyphomonadaceae bacterium]